jgi:hypothetical protein
MMMQRRFTLCALLLSAAIGSGAVRAESIDDSSRWWPAQKAPRVVVRSEKVTSDQDFGSRGVSARAEQALLQSIAGLAAQAVNEGRSDEMVWTDPGARTEYARWYAGMVKRLGVSEQGPFSTWELIRRYHARRIIKGYILYSADRTAPPEKKNGKRAPEAPADESINVAATLAGLLGGVIVTEELEPAAREAGLTKLVDVRGKTSTWCFDTYKDQLNRSFVLSQRPRVSYMRDVAIANRMLVMWGEKELKTSVYSWLNPLSTVIGWVSDEGEDVTHASQHGHVVIPSDLCLNVPLLSAGTSGAKTPPARVKNFDPRQLRLDDPRSTVSFILSDGDNLQWGMSGFFGDDYWTSPAHGNFPVGLGLPSGCLAQVCPEVMEHIAETQPAVSTIIQASGYIFPDLFGTALKPAQRRELLARHAKRLGQYTAQSGERTVVFIAKDVNSPAALEAYSIYAREIPDLLGMFVVQYAPYEAGDGGVHWVPNATGGEVPVVTAKFAMWANMQKPRAGNPERMATSINDAARIANAAGKPMNAWTMAHAWSGFRLEGAAPGKVVDLPVGDRSGARGLTPIGWCVERLDEKVVRVASPEELLWQIRMTRNADATKRLIEAEYNGGANTP